MAVRESEQEALKRWADLEALQEHYTDFIDFLVDVIEGVMGFVCTPVQEDIGKYLQYGPQYCMIQAQRGEAKTTITAAYAVWCLIQNPRTRVLIVAGNADLGYQISNWVIQIINSMPELMCLLPDTANGDRASRRAYDIHYTLRGAEKSPSVRTLGITGGLQGNRADLLIADDIEQGNSADTEVKREKLRLITADFTSICSNGRIIYLGTPQSVDSVYNSLPGRGYEVRIWPGRFPTVQEYDNYNGMLAPYITELIRKHPHVQSGGGPTGDRGKPTDPIIMSEEALTAKEIDQGPAYFQLQYMLDTKLMDKDRYPLNISRILVTGVGQETTPIQLNFMPSVENSIRLPIGHPMRGTPLYRVSSVSPEFVKFAGCYMYVDPSGGGANGDELAWAVTKFSAGYVYLVDIGGVPGGLHEENLNTLTAVASRWKPQRVGVERNYGNGALVQVWRPLLMAAHPCTIEEPWESGQKELRIIDALEPLLGSGRLVVDERLIEADWAQCQRYPAAVRASYSLFQQMGRITRERHALVHEDRLDALAGACRPWIEQLALTSQKVLEAKKAQEWRKIQKNPRGKPSYAMSTPKHTSLTFYNTHFRR